MAEKIDSKEIEKANSIMKELEKASGKMGKNQKDVNLAMKEYLETIKKANKEHKTLGQTIKESAGFMAGLIGADKLKDWQGMISKMVEVNSELHRSVINAGKGAESLALYKSTAIQLSTELGATHEAANSIVKTLTDKQFLGTPDQISKAAKSTYALARAFGISEKTVAENTVELQKWGQVSANTTTAMYADVLKVAQANGLTKEGVQEVMKSTTKWSGMLKAFGKAPEDVKKYNMSLAKTVSALEKVGVSAQTTTQMLEKLVDPTQIEENIPAYAALGISITDAISGNIDPDKMGEGLKAFGEKLKQMGPIAGAQYAKTMGISYKDAIKAASADMAEASQVEMTPEEKAYEQLTKMTEKTKDMTEQFKDIVNKTGGLMRGLGPIILTIAGIAFTHVAENFKKKLSESTKEGVKKGTEEGVKEGTKGIKETLGILIEKFERKGYDAAKEAKELSKRNEEERKNLLSMIKKGISAEDLFEERKKANAEKILSLKSDYDAKGKELLDNEEKLIKLRKDLSKKSNKDSRDVIMANIDYLKEKQKAILGEKENIFDKKKAAEQEGQNIEAEKETLKEKLNDANKGGAGDKAAAWADEQLKKIKQGLKDTGSFIAGKVKGAGGAIGEKLKDAGEKIASKLPKGLINAAGIAAKKIGSFARKAGAIGKAIGSSIAGKLRSVKVKVAGSPMGQIAGKLGGLAIVATIIGKILSKLQAPLDLILDNLIKQLEPVFEALMPIIMFLGDLLGMLVKLFLPPILKILSFLLKAIGMLAGVFSRKVGDAIKQSADKMSAAADKIRNSDSDLSKSVNDNTDAMKSKEKMTVSGGQVTVSKGGYEESKSGNKEEKQANSQSASTQTSNNQVVSNVNTENKASEGMITYLKTLNEKFDILISKLGNTKEKEDEEMIKSSVQAGVVDAIRNNVVTVKPEGGHSMSDWQTLLPGNATGARSN